MNAKKGNDMNAYERIWKALNHEEGDRVPTFTQSIEPKFILSFVREGGWKQLVKSRWSPHYDLKVARLLGYDSKWIHIGWNHPIYPRPEIPKEFPIKSNQHVGNSGIITEKNASGKSWYVDGIIKTPELMRTWISFIKSFSPGNLSHYQNFTQHVWKKFIAKDFVPIPTIGGPFYTTWASIGMNRLGYFMRKYPDLLNELINTWVNLTITEHSLLFEQDVNMVFICDDHAFKNHSMISPAQWDKFLLEPYKRLCNNAHKHNAKILFHSDGDLMEIMPQLINAGFDAAEPLEYEAGMLLKPLKEKYGDKITLIGNVAASDILCFGTVNDTIRATKQALLDAGEKGGLILSAGANILNDAKLENIRVMIDIVKKFGVYPLQKECLAL
jgi:hypothetical protein